MSAMTSYILFTGEFPTQKASSTENVSIWWFHHPMPVLILLEDD